MTIFWIGLILCNARIVQTLGWGKLDTSDSIDEPRAEEVLTKLCNAFRKGDVSGLTCNRLCFKRKWKITEFYEGDKTVIVIQNGGQKEIYKSSKPFFKQYEQPEEMLTNNEFIDKVVDVVNDELRLGWPKHYSRHLMDLLWPKLSSKKNTKLSLVDRKSLWTLLSQPEYILFRVLSLTRVMPKIIGTCGHMYQIEPLVVFRMKGNYITLKNKILVHLMGTFKLLETFLNEPLQWCDARYENLGLSANYPKRFMLMDGDMVYTRSKLNSMLEGRSCQSDEDCRIGDCRARCTADMVCTSRSDGNLEVFCNNFVNKLYRSKRGSATYLRACKNMTMSLSQRRAQLDLDIAWNLSEV